MLFGSSTEKEGINRSKIENYSLHDPQHGSFETNIEAETGLIQPCIITTHCPNQIDVLLRTDNGFLFKSSSTDYGLSFSKAQSYIPATNAAIGVTKIHDRGFISARNLNRSRSHIRISYHRFSDHQIVDIFDIFERVNRTGYAEVSYPSVLYLDNNRLVIAYSIQQKSIQVAEFKIDGLSFESEKMDA